MAKLDSLVGFRIGSADYQMLEKLARDRSDLVGKKIKISSVVRSLVRSALDERRFDRDDWDYLVPVVNEIFSVHREMAKIGGNLNQLSLAFNSGQGLDKSDLEASHDDLRDELQRVIKILRSIESGMRDRMHRF